MREDGRVKLEASVAAISVSKLKGATICASGETIKVKVSFTTFPGINVPFV